MKAIVTRQNNDGTFDSVGMNNRIVLGPYKNLQTIKILAFQFAGSRAYRIELYNTDNLFGEPHRVLRFAATPNEEK